MRVFNDRTKKRTSIIFLIHQLRKVGQNKIKYVKFIYFPIYFAFSFSDKSTFEISQRLISLVSIIFREAKNEQVIREFL